METTPSIQLSFPGHEPYLRFIVHLHQATRLHYDLRLELGAKLFNLVLPKGPSTDPRVCRLAIRTPGPREILSYLRRKNPSGMLRSGTSACLGYGCLCSTLLPKNSP